MCTKFKFDHTNKWYMHKPESVQENGTHKILWDFEVQTEKKERTCRIVDFTIPADHRVKLKESEKRDKFLDLARKLKNIRNMKMTVIPIVISALGTVN